MRCGNNYYDLGDFKLVTNVIEIACEGVRSGVEESKGGRDILCCKCLAIIKMNYVVMYMFDRKITEENGWLRMG